jgi:hypothetical protein
MTTDEFTLTMFLDALDLYGGTIESWPPPLQAQARELLSRSSSARASLDAMLQVEGYLDRTRLLSSPAAGAIVAAAMQKRQDRPRPAATRWVPWTAAGALALAAGVFVGFVTLPVTPQDYLGAALVQTDTSDVW